MTYCVMYSGKCDRDFCCMDTMPAGTAAKYRAALTEAVQQAHHELAAEDHRVAVEAAKDRLRRERARPWWHRYIPIINIQWRD